MLDPIGLFDGPLHPSPSAPYEQLITHLATEHTAKDNICAACDQVSSVVSIERVAIVTDHYGTVYVPGLVLLCERCTKAYKWDILD